MVEKIENRKIEKAAHTGVSPAGQKIVETPKTKVKADTKDDEKLNELKIELLKQTTKKRDIKREIARLLTLQNKSGEAKK